MKVFLKFVCVIPRFILLTSSFTFAWQRDTIIDIFYEKHLDQLIEVITASCPSENVDHASSKSVGPGRRIQCQNRTKPEILSNICELLCFCVLHHPYRIKYFLDAHYVIIWNVFPHQVNWNMIVLSLLFTGATFFLTMWLTKFCYLLEEEKNT